MRRLWGIRVEAEVETQGLDVSEHGMWGYPEFYIPVPGGYDAWVTPPWERQRAAPPPVTAKPAPQPSGQCQLTAGDGQRPPPAQPLRPKTPRSSAAGAGAW